MPIECARKKAAVRKIVPDRSFRLKRENQFLLAL